VKRGSRSGIGELLSWCFFSLDGLPVERFDSHEAASEAAALSAMLKDMTKEELNDQCKEWNMPIFPKGVFKDECLNRMLYVALLWSLPLSELEKECKHLGVSMSEVQRSDAGERRAAMLDHATFYMCWDGFIDKGIDVESIACLSRAWQLHDECKKIDASTLPELKARYESMGLSAASLHKWAVADRLKQVITWFLMPLPDLQKLCREYHVSSGMDQEDLSLRLAKKFFGSDWQPGGRSSPHVWSNSGAWQPSGPTPPFQQRKPGGPMPSQMPYQTPGHRLPQCPPPKPPSRAGPSARPAPPEPPPRPAPQSTARRKKPGVPAKMAEHFRTLGLTTSADVEDVKRAYRRLALKYHPDKNIGDEQDGKAQEFLKVQAAYKALVDYFKFHGDTE